jgi:hypothetical protein
MAAEDSAALLRFRPSNGEFTRRLVENRRMEPKGIDGRALISVVLRWCAKLNANRRGTKLTSKQSIPFEKFSVLPLECFSQ